jgi:ESS family glutamate:Na+ symporter
MTPDWAIVINIALIFVLMFAAKMIKEKLGIFKNVIIPTSLLAGFFGLIIGPQVIGLIDFDLLLYEKMVFHFMAIGFIALTLSEQSVKQKSDSVKSGLFIVATYCFQGVVGMLAVLALIYTIKPKQFEE